MENTSVLSKFRILAPKFKAVADDIVNAWIELTAPLVGQRRFGNLHGQALALLTAHRMELAGIGKAEGDLDGIGGIVDIRHIASYKEGQTSVTFNHDLGEAGSADAELGLTEYGMQFLSLRRKRVVPLVSAAERRGW